MPCMNAATRWHIDGAPKRTPAHLTAVVKESSPEVADLASPYLATRTDLDG